MYVIRLPILRIAGAHSTDCAAWSSILAPIFLYAEVDIKVYHIVNKDYFDRRSISAIFVIFAAQTHSFEFKGRAQILGVSFHGTTYFSKLTHFTLSD